MPKVELIQCPGGCGRKAPAAQLHSVHMRSGTRKRCVSVVIYRQKYMPEDVHDGDIDAPYEEDTVPLDYEFGHDPFPVQASIVLEAEGLTEFSDTGGWTERGWYSHPDGSTVSGAMGNYTGLREIATGHVYGMTERESRALWELVGLIA